jgi:hypothetical protein
MQLMVAELQKRLTPERGIQLHTGCTLVGLEPVAHPPGGPSGGDDVGSDAGAGANRIRLRFADGSTVIAREVVLALPQRPLARLDLGPLRRDINSVVGIPLLKVFFIVDQPWWEDNRPSNRFAADLPTREIYYWKSKDKSKGVLMVYTDRPALQFWTDYLDAPGDDASEAQVGAAAEVTPLRQEKAATWILGDEGARSEEQLPNRRLWQRFVQYARDYEHNDFTADRLIACGMRDWGREPYDGAVHVWRPRQKSWEVMSRMTAFGLVDGATNVHVCGDAYSDYQGFIEGALRSTARVLTYFVNGSTGAPFDDRRFLEDLRLPPLDLLGKIE